MRLDALSVTGLRCLAQVADIPILAPTVLTGPNDSGKSSVLLALEVLLDNQDVPDEARTRGASVEGSDVIVEGRFALHADEQQELDLPERVQVRRIVPEAGPVRLEVLRMVPDDGRLHRIETMPLADLKALATEYEVTPEGGTTKPYWLEALREHAETAPHVQAWVTAGRDLVRRLPVLLSFDGAASVRPDDAVLKALTAKYRAHMEDPEITDQLTALEEELEDRIKQDAAELCRHVEDCYDDLGTVEVRPTVSLVGKGLQAAALATETSAGSVSLSATGTGRSRRVSLAVWDWVSEALTGDEERRRDVVVAYDEPDTHLDYSHQRTIMEMISRHCRDPRVRMVITTHSMNLVDGVDLDKIVHLTLQDGATNVSRLAPECDHGERDTFLRDMAAAVGLRNSILIHERLFVGVEGATEQEAFPALFRLHTDGRTLQSAGIALWACGNDIGALHFAAFLAGHDRNVAFVVDEDCRTNQRRRFSEESLRRVGIDPDGRAHYLGNPSEFEELFSDEQWVAVANVEWPRRDGREWTPADVERCRIGKFSRQWQQELNRAIDCGPLGKPAIARSMAWSLRTAEEIPQQLRATFGSLITLADS